MPTASFAAAQERIAARRAQHASQRARHESTQTSSHPASRSPNTSTPSTTPSTKSLISLFTSRTGTRPAFRVGQIDASLLDTELLGLLTTQVQSALQHFGTHVADAWGPEIQLVLQAALFKLSVWDQNASYGAHLQGLRYADARRQRGAGATHPLPKSWQKALLGLITVGGSYAWAKWEAHLLSTSEDTHAGPSTRTQLLTRLTDLATTAHDSLSLLSFLTFLLNGRYRSLTDRLLRLRLAPAANGMAREVSFEYLNRQLVWHAFTEFLLFLLPLVGVARWRRILSRSWKSLRTAFLTLMGRHPASAPSSSDASSSTSTTAAPTGPLAHLPPRTCAICHTLAYPTATSEAELLAQPAAAPGILGSSQTDITNPYAAQPCGCVYCFVCLGSRSAGEEGEGWGCLRCGASVTACAPWGGDVLPPRSGAVGKGKGADERPVSRRSVGFVDEGYEGEGERDGLRVVEPRPEDEGRDGEDDERAGDMSRALEERGMGWAESAEWARISADSSASDVRSESGGEDEEDVASASSSEFGR